jgi:glycosyltransferase involved in cell wall biosynthesis
MRLVYFTPSDLQIPRVDRQCILRFCDALAAKGVDVEVVSLRVALDHDEPSLHMPLEEVYGLEAPIDIRLLRSGLRQDSSEKALSIQRTLAYTIASMRMILARSHRAGRMTFYFKNPLLALPFALLRAVRPRRLTLVLELHDLPRSRLKRFLIGQADLLISNHPALTEDVREIADSADVPLITLNQGVNLDALERDRVSRVEARERLGLPADQRLVVYTGKIFEGWREAELLIEAATHFEEGVVLVLVGGRGDQLPYFRKKIADHGLQNVVLTGFVAPSQTYLYQLAADILVTYYTYDKPLLKYVNPGKLFEYMASQRPIVSADHPALRHFLTDEEAVFVQPEDPPSLAAAINQLAADAARQASLAERAYSKVFHYTWRARADAFLASVRRLVHAA